MRVLWFFVPDPRFPYILFIGNLSTLHFTLFEQKKLTKMVGGLYLGKNDNLCDFIRDLFDFVTFYGFYRQIIYFLFYILCFIRFSYVFVVHILKIVYWCMCLNNSKFLLFFTSTMFLEVKRCPVRVLSNVVGSRSAEHLGNKSTEKATDKVGCTA